MIIWRTFLRMRAILSRSTLLFAATVGYWSTAYAFCPFKTSRIYPDYGAKCTEQCRILIVIPIFLSAG